MDFSTGKGARDGQGPQSTFTLKFKKLKKRWLQSPLERINILSTQSVSRVLARGRETKKRETKEWRRRRKKMERVSAGKERGGGGGGGGGGGRRSGAVTN
jgi:hypothetical protein